MKKSNSRRLAIKQGVYGALSLPFLSSGLISCKGESVDSSGNSQGIDPMNILILGGTSFLGPHQVAYALSRGHSVSTFTRGKTKPTVHAELFEEVEQLIGDRENDLSALSNRKWDLVIDNSGHKTEWTEKTAKLLKDHVGLYLYTSSTGVYYPYLGSDIDEDTKLNLVEPEGVVDEDLKMEYWYGVMKANSELATLREFGEDRSIVVRPTYMIGPADKLDRFIHWPVRLSRGGEVLVPGKKEDLVQYIDVRDVAEWMIRLGEQKRTGTFNAVGPAEDQTMRQFVHLAKEAFDATTSFVYIDDYDFLKQQDVPYIVPWIPSEGNNYGSARINNKKALAAGLSIRPLVDSVRDTHTWWYWDAMSQDRRDEFEQKEGSVLIRESEIIEKWKLAERK